MRKRLFEIIEVSKDNDESSLIYDWFMFITIIVSISPLFFVGKTSLLFTWIDRITVIIFIFDYLARLFRQEIEGSGEFELVEYHGVWEKAKIKHKICDSVFEITCSCFLDKPFCRVCNPTFSTEESFKSEMKDLVGDEYTLVSKYTTKHAKVDIRHNICGNVQSIQPINFLAGARCKKCYKPIKDPQLDKILRETSQNRYQIKERISNDYVVVKDLQTGNEIKTTTKRIMQELLRPTPSDFLPIQGKKPIVRIEGSKRTIILNWLKDHYSNDELIHLEDIQIDSIVRGTIKSSIRNLVSQKILRAVFPGIYEWNNANHSSLEIIESRYLIRNGHRIGFLAGQSFTAELGMANAPEKIHIITNKESSLQWRDQNFPVIDLRLHGSVTKITEDNYRQLAVMEFLKTEKQYIKDSSEQEVEEKLRRYLEGVRIGDFEELFQYYPDWMKDRIIRILE